MRYQKTTFLRLIARSSLSAPVSESFGLRYRFLVDKNRFLKAYRTTSIGYFIFLIDRQVFG